MSKGQALSCSFLSSRVLVGQRTLWVTLLASVRYYSDNIVIPKNLKLCTILSCSILFGVLSRPLRWTG